MLYIVTVVFFAPCTNILTYLLTNCKAYGTLGRELCENWWTDRDALWMLSWVGPGNMYYMRMQMPTGSGTF